MGAAGRPQPYRRTHNERSLARDAQAAVEAGENLAGAQHSGGGAGQRDRRAHQALLCCVLDGVGLTPHCRGHGTIQWVGGKEEEYNDGKELAGGSWQLVVAAHRRQTLAATSETRCSKGARGG